ncbi:unnamed protein product [Rotaria socialis]|uniref:Uncharacterized protein n=1 Tax=Rotaria socialis TaxID=392032 RepID=A0A820XN64_9BILA|nr:unnamed protein product [Rotaria socialis]
MITPTAPLPSTADPNYIELIPNETTTDEERMQKFAEIAARYEISHEFASRLQQLEGYDIVFLCDDSCSMGTAIERVLKYERKEADRILITFCACTDDDQAVGYLNRWDETIPYLDVCDDYRSERKEAWRVQGRQFPFSFGDYVVKILLSSIDRYFDSLDQKLIGSQKATACCSLM